MIPVSFQKLFFFKISIDLSMVFGSSLCFEAFLKIDLNKNLEKNTISRCILLKTKLRLLLSRDSIEKSKQRFGSSSQLKAILLFRDCA